MKCRKGQFGWTLPSSSRLEALELICWCSSDWGAGGNGAIDASLPAGWGSALPPVSLAGVEGLYGFWAVLGVLLVRRLPPKGSFSILFARDWLNNCQVFNIFSMPKFEKPEIGKQIWETACPEKCFVHTFQCQREADKTSNQKQMPTSLDNAVCSP